MKREGLRTLLAEVAGGGRSVDEAMEALRHWPGEQLACAHLDHHRAMRTGFPEVVFGEGKSAEQLIVILRQFQPRQTVVMATRVDAAKAVQVQEALPEFVYHSEARMLTANLEAVTLDKGRGAIVVVSAGTSDIPVAEEACLTAQALGNKVERLYDVGVAGLHRLLGQREVLSAARVLIVVAGMEGALPSVVGGLVDKPIIAVPTSVGYGTGFGGIAALLGMLNSCAPGVAVVNIDNGFGAACVAAAINRKEGEGCE
ncbi:MAG: nickel pincer cofactor biosynthesis protein LarB [Thermodesulfobacteriota bacterium]